MAMALGVRCMTTSSATVSLAKRIAPFAAKYRITVGMHGRTNVKDPNEFARPESYEAAMSFSPYIGLNLDIGHFFAAGFDPVQFIQKHHARIVCVHLRDRKKDGGPIQPFGEGDTPVRECLQLLKRNRWNFPANIEHAYRPGDPAENFRQAYEYCRKVLA
jgi:sugar phosphate isomerase/epimerase